MPARHFLAPRETETAASVVKLTVQTTALSPNGYGEVFACPRASSCRPSAAVFGPFDLRGWRLEAAAWSRGRHRLGGGERRRDDESRPPAAKERSCSENRLDTQSGLGPFVSNRVV